jgi:hypothetical protein
MPLVTSLLAVTISCPNPLDLVHLATTCLGWEIYYEGAVNDDMEKAWGIAPGSAGSSFTVLTSPGIARGMIRVVQGRERHRSRTLAARWAGVEILVTRDIDALYERLSVHPAFVPMCAPFNMDWSAFGSNIHRAFIGRGPGGTHLAFTMAVTRPQGRSFPSAENPVGYIFDVPLITGAFEHSSRFYRQTLGMIPFLESRFDQGPWHELWDIPEGSPVALDILKGDAPGTGLGGIEMQGYDENLIDSDEAVPDRLDGGACMITYTTADIDRVYKSLLKSKEARILSEPMLIGEKYCRDRRVFTFLGPDGERVEICEA